MRASQKFYIIWLNTMEKFNFFRSFLDTARAIEDESLRLKYLMAVAEYWLEWKESDDQLVKALMVQTQFVLDRSKELKKLKSECMKWNSNAVKNYENISKQRKTEKNGEKQKKQEIEIEEETEKGIKKKETYKEKSLCNELHDEYSFELFWSKYPVKKDKKKAQSKFKSMSLERRKLAIEGIDKLRKSDQWQRWFIPLPTTYINGERREDEVESTTIWIERLKERERQRIREEAQEILNRSKKEDGKPIQTESYNRRSNFESG